MTTNYKKVFFGAIVAVAGFAIAIPARAVEYILQGISCIDDGLCTPCDLIDVGVNGAEMILGLSGVFILLFFIYGGLMWMTSYGDSKKVEKGASAIKAAFIGMVIVFVAYSVVELLWQALKVNKPFANSIGCTPLNIQSDGFLGNSDTGGGRGPGTNGSSGGTGQPAPDDEWNLDGTPRSIDDEQPITGPDGSDPEGERAPTDLDDVEPAVVVPL